MRLADQSWRVLRTAQTFFPRLRDLKYASQTAFRQLTRRPFEYEFRILETLPLDDDALFLDIGANQGQSIQAIRLFRGRNPIACFEANALLAAKLEREHAGDPALEVHACGLGEQRESQHLFVPEYRGYVFDGLASFSRENAQGWLNERTIIGFRPDLLKIHEMKAEIRTLDEFEMAPAFVKINVQGWEHPVVNGGVDTIRRHRPILFIESPDPVALTPQLERWGYINFTFDRGRLRIGCPDHYRRLFVHQDGLDAVRHLLEADYAPPAPDAAGCPL